MLNLAISPGHGLAFSGDYQPASFAIATPSELPAEGKGLNLSQSIVRGFDRRNYAREGLTKSGNDGVADRCRHSRLIFFGDVANGDGGFRRCNDGTGLSPSRGCSGAAIL